MRKMTFPLAAAGALWLRGKQYLYDESRPTAAQESYENFRPFFVVEGYRAAKDHLKRSN